MRSTITEAALALSRWVELSILGKATIMLVLGLTVSRLAGRARASVRHLLLTATFGMLLALPLIVVTAPAVTIAIPVSQAGGPVTETRVVTTRDALIPPTGNSPGRRAPESSSWSVPSWPTMLRSGWIASALLLLVPLAFDLWRLRRVRLHGLPWPELRGLMQSLAAECGIRRSVEVLIHEDIQAPLTCGVWRPAILLPLDAREWSAADLRRALVHELEHVRRGDWPIQLAARATCACYWFHPLVWVALRRLCLEAERACDDAVVQSAERTEYAEQLVLLARRLSNSHPQAMLGMASRSDLSTRVSALLDGSQRRGRVGLLAAASAMIMASVVVLSIAPVRAVALSTNPTDTVSQDSGTQTEDTRQRRSSPLDRALYEAVESGEISEIERLLNAGANVNCALDGDGSPLIGAARKGRLAAVRLLLDRGADPNMPVSGDGNPLIMAAREGHADVVTLLLDRGAKIDEMVPSDENALIQASWKGRLQVVKLLVERGANVNARIWVERDFPGATGELRTSLSMARKGGHEAVVAFLLAAGARE
jgi:bla regulator protein blaR1